MQSASAGRVPPGTLRPSHSLCVRTVRQRKCRNIIFCPFRISWQLPGVWWAIDHPIRNSAHQLLSPPVRRHQENWRGGTTCREYRWATIDTSIAPVRRAPPGRNWKDIALKDSVLYRSIRSGCWSSIIRRCVFTRLRILSFFFFFCSIPEVKTGCLPSVLLEARRKPIEQTNKQKNPESAETHL